MDDLFHDARPLRRYPRIPGVKLPVLRMGGACGRSRVFNNYDEKRIFAFLYVIGS